jgi:hypothetical protein
MHRAPPTEVPSNAPTTKIMNVMPVTPLLGLVQTVCAAL